MDLLLLDVDGVLTDGRISINDAGRLWDLRSFHIHDGAGIKFLSLVGIPVVWISGRGGAGLDRRAAELGVAAVFQKVNDKLSVYRETIHPRFGVPDDRVCYVGDDIIDLGVMGVVGLPVAVADARPEVRRAARYVTRAPGGSGAVREVVDHIIAARDAWGSVRTHYGS